jgi:hypothetical protein
MKKLSEIVTGEALDAAEQIASDAKADPGTRKAAAELIDLAGSYRQLYSKAKAAKKLDDPEIAPSLRGVAEKMRGLDEFLRQPNAPKSLAASDAASGYGPRGIEGTEEPVHAWTQAFLNRLNGKTIRDVGTFSVEVPVSGLSYKAWPTDSIADESPDPTPYEIPRRARFVADLLGARSVDDGTTSYLRQTVRTNLATAVARHAAKPESTYELTRIEDRPRTIAHLSDAIAVQDLEDNVALDGFLRAELIQGLRLGLDTQIVSGDGLGENMEGLFEVITETQTFATDAATSARKALTTLLARDVVPSAFIMTPAGWEAIELDSIASAQHLSQAPVDRADQRLWSIPVVLSTAAPAGFALLGDFSGARLANRSQARIDVATSGDRGGTAGEDLFEFNEVRFRAELRSVLEVLSIPKFTQVDLVTP